MIRKATPEDISRIAEIMVFGKRVAYRSIFNNDIGTFQDLQVIYEMEKLQKDPKAIDSMLVYDDGILKGVINAITAGNDIEICDFYVEPFFKGQGIGSKLLQYVLEKAKKAQIRRIFLWVLEENHPARKFYEANGFVYSGASCLVYGTTKIDMCYECQTNEG